MGKIMVAVKVLPATRKRLEAAAAKVGYSISEVMRHGLYRIVEEIESAEGETLSRIILGINESEAKDRGIKINAFYVDSQEDKEFIESYLRSKGKL